MSLPPSLTNGPVTLGRSIILVKDWSHVSSSLSKRLLCLASGSHGKQWLTYDVTDVIPLIARPHGNILDIRVVFGLFLAVSVQLWNKYHLVKNQTGLLDINVKIWITSDEVLSGWEPPSSELNSHCAVICTIKPWTLTLTNHLLSALPRCPDPCCVTCPWLSLLRLFSPSHNPPHPLSLSLSTVCHTPLELTLGWKILVGELVSNKLLPGWPVTYAVITNVWPYIKTNII